MFGDVLSATFLLHSMHFSSFHPIKMQMIKTHVTYLKLKRDGGITLRRNNIGRVVGLTISKYLVMRETKAGKPTGLGNATTCPL